MRYENLLPTRKTYSAGSGYVYDTLSGSPRCEIRMQVGLDYIDERG